MLIKRYQLLFACVLIMLFVILVGSLSVSAQQSGTITVFPVPDNNYLENPGIGWQNTPGNLPYLLPETLSYASRSDISWQILNPSQGTYFWDPLDTAIQQANTAGKLASFRVYTMKGESFGGHQVPQWVVDIDPTVIQATNGSPHYNNCTYQDTWSVFVEALRQRYDGDSRIAFIDISGYGNFSEWNWLNDQTLWEDDYMIPETLDGMARNRLADMFIGGSNLTHSCENSAGLPENRNYAYTGFQSRQLLMPYAGTQQSSRYVAERRSDVGIRYDCLGRASSNFLNKIGDVVANTWATAPIVFEFCGGFGATPEIIDVSRNFINVAHASIVHDNLIEPRDALAIEELMRNVGYRYTLAEATYSGVITPGDNLNLSMQWQNIGTSPAYPRLGYDFRLEIYLLDSESNVVASALSAGDIASWMPADRKSVV